METNSGAGIFSECSIAFVPSSRLAPRLICDLTRVLEDNGASICEPRRDGLVPIEKVTHIISNTIDFPQYVETQAVMIPVVSTQWITMSISRHKQAQVRPYSPDPRMIFTQVIVTCAGLPAMDKESIIGATMALGGQGKKDASRLTTHICALSEDDPKVANAFKKGFKGKVVLPHWFDDCFKLGKRIDEGPYLFPKPEVLKKGLEDELIIPVNANLAEASSAIPQWAVPLPLDSDGVRLPVTVFRDRKVLLSNDLNISSRFAKAIQEIIVLGGGRMVDDVAVCDMLICQYRDGPQYIKASQSCKEVGSLSWLYYLIVHNQWRSPLHRLLHYPIPRHGIEGFKNLRITVSNYGGDARIYLENLITACGAEFTKTMKADNTHLITARNSSDKCKAAPEWGVAVANHLWLEESYAKCKMEQINVPKYNHFPPRTNLGEIIGQTFFDESRLRELYYPGGEESLSPRAKRRRRVLDAAEDNIYRQGPAKDLALSRTETEREFDGMRDDLADQDERPRKKAAKVAAVETPLRTRRPNHGKQDESPSVISTGSRSAKAKAQDRLQHIAPDIALWEKEKRQTKGGAPWGGKKATNLAEKEQATKSAAKTLHGDDGDGDAARPVNKGRPSLPEVETRIVVTAFDRWVGNQHKENQDRRKLRDVGIQIVQEGLPCDFVAAPKIVRTVKFLCALAHGVTVISTDFIDKVLDSGQTPSPDDYLLQDEAAEKKYNFKLHISTARARSNRGRLLQGIPIYCTENVRNGHGSYKAIAETNGAIFKLYGARSGTTIKPTTAEDDHAPPDPVYLLSGISGEEQKMWPKFREMAEKGNMEARIVAPDWLLDVAMAQQVRFDRHFLVQNFHEDELR